MSFWSDLSKATAPTGEYANLDPATLQSTIQSLLAQQAANGGANADPVFARELEKAGYMGGSLPNLPQMDITDYNYAGPNTAKVNGQPVTYAALGQGFGEYRQDPNVPNEYFSYSSQGDNSRSQAYGIDPSGQYIVMSRPTMTPPPRATRNRDAMDLINPVTMAGLSAFAGPQIAGALGSAGLSAGAAAAGTGAILGGGGAALTGGDIGRGALMGGATAAIGNGIFGGSTPDGVIPEFDYAAGGSNGMYNPSAVSYPVNALAPPVSFNNPEAVAGGDLSAFEYPTLTGAEAQTYGAPASGYYGLPSPTMPPAIPPSVAEVATMPPAIPPFNPNSTIGDPLYGGQGGGVGASVGGGVGAGAAAAVTPGLIAKVAAYTGLSTGAIERLGGAAISSLAGLYGAGMVGSAADRAAKGIADANASSNALLADIDARNRAREEPFYQAGVNALPAYTKGVMPGGDLVRPFSMADYQADPGYGFRMSEGMKALDRSAASRGLLRSGPTIAGAIERGQNLATAEYDRAYNRFNSDQATRRNALASLTGFAPTASSAIRSSDMAYGGNATNLASNTANAMAGAGATRASAYGNALAGIGQNAYNALSPNPFAQYMQRPIG